MPILNFLPRLHSSMVRGFQHRLLHYTLVRTTSTTPSDIEEGSSGEPSGNQSSAERPEVNAQDTVLANEPEQEADTAAQNG
ncbi:hypothetical protein ACLMJK_008784 [Lecanora helva]